MFSRSETSLEDEEGREYGEEGRDGRIREPREVEARFWRHFLVVTWLEKDNVTIDRDDGRRFVGSRMLKAKLIWVQGLTAL